MSNSSLILSSIDFDTLKQNFKTYLETQSVFKDYNFEGSNINVLLDVMSYNSYLNSFYLNMVASEMFLDSAQKYDSVVSHAKELNYLPRSTRSSAANISFDIQTDGIIGQFIIPKGTKFTGINSNGSFTFTTDELNSYISGSNVFSVSNLSIYEGSYFQDSFLVDYTIENQQFVLSNKNIDTNSLTITVVENNGANSTVFNKADTLYGLNDSSSVYFLQAAQNNLYEIVFGDGLFGRKPLNSSSILASYRISSGTDADGISSFTLDDELGAINNGSADPQEITVLSNSNSGANQESIDSIKFSAPRYFATQQRAVASDDYSSLILSNFGGEISDVIVYGGETVEPKQYGRVIVTIKPTTGTIAPDYLKNQISNYLLDYIALPNRVIFNDPDYFYCSIVSSVQYDKTISSKTASEIKSLVLNSIINYSSTNLEQFGNDLRYSRLVAGIDNCDPSVTSNDTELRIIKRLSPKLNYATSYVIDINNVIYYEGQTIDTGIAHTELYTTSFDTHVEHAALISSQFTYTKNDINYSLSYIADDGAGLLRIYTTVNQVITAIDNIGTIDYANGIISINNLLTSSYTNYISLYVRLRDKDIFANQNKIILIDPNDVDITIIETVK